MLRVEIRNETLVFTGTEVQKLRYVPALGSKLTIQGPQTGPSFFEEGIDYIIDYVEGKVRRSDQSRIPDWRDHPMFGKKRFDHRDYPEYSNDRYTCTIDYSTNVDEEVIGKVDEKAEDKRNLSLVLPRLYERLTRQKEAIYAVFGDSISTGAEASRKEWAFHERFITGIRNRYPDAEIRLQMKAMGGENSRRGLERIHEVIALQPDLVTIGYGMNDQNRQQDGSNAISPEEFERNIGEMVSKVQKETSGDVIMITPCLPNPHWILASGNMDDYAEAVRRVGHSAGVAVADVQRLWKEELAAGKTHECLLLNNLNHPNDYGHKLYYSALEPFLQ